MLLAVDVGNTQTVLGLFEGDALAEHWRVATEAERTGDELGALLGRCSSCATSTSRTSSASASRPRCRRSCARTRSFAERLRRGAAARGRAGDEDRHPDPLRRPARGRARTGSSTRSPRASATARRASSSTSAPRRTSTRSRRAGEYVGGVLAPGIEISMDALFARAARLTKVDFVAPRARDRQDDDVARSSRASSTASPARWTGSSSACAASSATARASSRPAASRT